MPNSLLNDKILYSFGQNFLFNFEFNENGGKFFKMVENTVGKGEIACYEQFLLFPQCFHNSFIADM